MSSQPPSPSPPRRDETRRRGASSGGGGDSRRRRRSRRGQRHSWRLAIATGLALVAFVGGAIVWIVLEHRAGLPLVATDSRMEGTAGNAVEAPAQTSPPAVSCPASIEQRRSHIALAAACADSRQVRALISQGQPADASDPRVEFAGRTALHHAAQLGDSGTIEDLLSAGADPNKTDAAGNTPLHLVASSPHVRHPEFVARRLLEGGGRIDLRNAGGRTPLQELELDHDRLMKHQNLAKVLYQRERSAMMREWLGPPPPSGPILAEAEGRTGDEVIVVQTSDGPIRIPIDPPAAGPPDE
ncbi:MAG: ankyrin repeat domain-containing protein [Zoogloeaceae bacterium]|nr:ankyrin repeat domain-containing protein [Zoogloeaceae bacterium]